MPRKLTHEEFMEKFYKKNKNAENIEILGKYEGSKIKIKCKCKIDNNEFEITPSDLLNNHGCPKCGKVYRKTHEEFILEIKEKNPNIEILGEYINSKTKIKCKCKIDNNEFEITPSDLLNNHGCPKCGEKRRIEKQTKTHEEFMEEFYIKNENAENIEILGTYKKNNIKIKCKCKIDNNEFEIKPNDLLNGHGCPKCGKVYRKTHEEFIQEMKKINENIEILGEYKGNKTKIKCRCKIDNNEFEMRPNNLLNGQGCPKCNASKGEKRIAKYLDNRNIKYIHDKRYFKDLKSSKNKMLRPDFIIENMKIWIEYDGEQHFRIVDYSSNKDYKKAEEQFKIIQENDRLKNEYAKKHGWKLIRIPYTEYDNIEKILDKDLKED